MNPGSGSDDLAQMLAEDVLRAIYGDDYKGCTANPTQIAALIQARLKQSRQSATDLIDLYEKVVEAIHLLSTPPQSDKVFDPVALQTLLSERLDKIHEITSKTMQTTSELRQKV